MSTLAKIEKSDPVKAGAILNLATTDQGHSAMLKGRG
jgi:hypothetical protein